MNKSRNTKTTKNRLMKKPNRDSRWKTVPAMANTNKIMPKNTFNFASPLSFINFKYVIKIKNQI